MPRNRSVVRARRRAQKRTRYWPAVTFAALALAVGVTTIVESRRTNGSNDAAMASAEKQTADYLARVAGTSDDPALRKRVDVPKVPQPWEDQKATHVAPTEKGFTPAWKVHPPVPDRAMAAPAPRPPRDPAGDHPPWTWPGFVTVVER